MSSEIDPFLLDAAKQIESDLIYFGELQDQTKDLWTFAGFDPEAYQHAKTILDFNSAEYNRLLPIFMANMDAQSILTTDPRNPTALATLQQTEDALITSEDITRAKSILASNLDDLIQREASQNLSPTERAASNAFIQRETQARAAAQRKLDAYNPKSTMVTDALTTHFKFQEVTHQLQIIERFLQLPITGDLNRLIENYKSERYTRDCLHVGHSDKFCWESAVKYGNTPTVRTIMDHRTTGWPTKSIVENAAKIAVANDNGELLDILLEADDPEEPAHQGRLLFEVAYDIVALDRLDLLDRIYSRLEEAALGDEDDNYELASELAIRAMIDDRPRILEYIWNRGPQDDLIDSLPYAALEYGKPQYVEWLLQRAPDEAYTIYQRAFEGAARSGDATAVRLYLPYFNVHNRGLALTLAIDSGNYEVVDLILNAFRMDPLDTPEILVWPASMDLNVYARLLDSIPDVSDIHIDDRISAVEGVVNPGDTPLNPNSTYTRTEELKLAILGRLLDGVPITPNLVVSALKQGELQVANFLIQRRPDILGASADMLVNSIDDAYLQEMDLRLAHLHRLALDTGALSDSLDDYLVWAARIGSPELVRYLLAQGADPTYADHSALAAAKLSGNNGTIAILQQARHS